MRKGVVAGVIAGLVVIVAILVASRHAVVSAVLPRAIGLATGYDVTIGDEHFTAHHGALLHVHVSKGGEPVLDAERIDVSYSLRDLLPGSKHRYGVSAIAIDRPSLTLVRHKDGSYNVTFPSGAGPAPIGPQPVNHVPIALTVRIRDASGQVRAPYTVDPQARSIAVHGVNLDAVVNTDARTHYKLTGAFVEHPDEPFTAIGTVDVDRGYAMHHIYAAALPMRAIANYFINSKAARILGGSASNLDVRIYALDVQRYQPVAYHTGLSLDITNGGISVLGLAKPLGDISGRLQLVDDAFVINNVNGTLAGLPVHITGAIYNFASPQYKLGVTASGDLKKLRTAFAFMNTQPVSGSVKLGVLIEGPLDSPVIVANADATNAAYQNIPLHDVHAAVSYDRGNVFFSPLSARTGGANVSLRGMLSTGTPVHSELAFHMEAPADRLPYAGELLGTEPLVADAIMDGRDTNFHAHGALTSLKGPDRVMAAFDFEPQGLITVAPVWIQTERGTLAGAYHLDRKTDASAYWIASDGFRVRTPQHASFLNVALPALPPMEATIDKAVFTGGGPSGYNAVAAGEIQAHAARIAGVRIDALDARFAGTLSNLGIAPVHANGPWGTIAASGQYARNTLYLRGAYRGTLTGLRPFLANTPAQGAIDGPVAIAIAPNYVTVQAENVALHGASIRGIPISRATGTLAIAGGTLQIYNAHASIAGGDIVAAGAYDTSNRPGSKALSLVAAGLHGAGLRSIGLPLEDGRVDASGKLGGDAPLPRFDGGVAVSNGRMQRYHIAGSSLVHLDGDSAQLDHVVGGLNGTYTLASGTLGTLTSGTPSYRLHTYVPAGDIGHVLQMLALPAYNTQGTFNGSLTIGGSGLHPSVEGTMRVPAGDVNGLSFIDASALISADPNGVRARRGSVLVGTTRVQFAARKQPAISGVHVRAPYAHLSDFDNFFDTGDTLHGDGAVNFNLVSQQHRIVSNGNVDLRKFRYRNLAIGDTRAYWSSRRNLLQGSIAVGGESGSLHAKGDIALAPSPVWQNVVTQSRYNLQVDLDEADLSTWVAALGFPEIPITGHVDADATVTGRYPALSLRGTSELHQGTIWRLPIDSFGLSFSSNRERISIDKAEMTAAGIEANAQGSFGLAKNAPLDFSLHASTSDLPRFVAQLWRYEIPVTGSFESTVRVGGSFARPTFDAAFDASNVDAYHLKIVSAFGELRLHDRSLELRNAGVALDKGEMTLAGTLPLQLGPFGAASPNAPVSFDLSVNAVDPADFEPLLANNTKLGGAINGEVGLRGTRAQPRIFGQFSIEHGSYVSDFDRVPVTDITTALTFNRTEATVEKLHALFGSGSVDGSGRILLPQGLENAGSSGTAFDVTAVAKGAQLDLPAYGRGTVDAKLALSKKAGSQALLKGDTVLENATIPFAAFLAATQSSSSSGASGLPFDLGFDLSLKAGKNVRVRGGGVGAGLDIGATGAAHLAGDLNAPTLSGGFTSTGGTLTYVDRAFRVQQASVAFDPANGVIPNLHAVGVTHVSNPDPDPARNPYGSADITINVDGPVTNLKVAFESSPPGYSREQILAMIAPFGGFINGIGYTPGLPQTAPGSPQQLGALQPVPGSTLATQQSGTISVGQEAFNILNTQFTAGLLSPLETAISQGLGFQDINLTVDYYGNVGFSARKVLGRTVNFIYSSTFGLPMRQSFGLALQGSDATSAQLSFFFQNGPTRLFQTPETIVTTNSRLNIGEALQGTSGFSFTLQRLYW